MFLVSITLWSEDAATFWLKKWVSLIFPNLQINTKQAVLWNFALFTCTQQLVTVTCALELFSSSVIDAETVSRFLPDIQSKARFLTNDMLIVSWSTFSMLSYLLIPWAWWKLQSFNKLWHSCAFRLTCLQVYTVIIWGSTNQSFSGWRRIGALYQKLPSQPWLEYGGLSMLKYALSYPLINFPFQALNCFRCRHEISNSSCFRAPFASGNFEILR